MVKCLNQESGKNWILYNGDCVEVMQGIPDNTVGFSVFSPPFAELFAYSDSIRDMGNSSDYDQFFEQFGYCVKQLHRILMPGRNIAVHCMDLPRTKTMGNEISIKDFPGDIVRLFERCGFVFHARVVIWKDPLIAATRTKALGLAHKQIVKDSAMCRTGIPDQLVVFRKPGENPKPISHDYGLIEYYGSRKVPAELDKYIGYKGDQRTNKRSHWIWQQYASPIWFDIRQTNVLPHREARDGKDQKHICPLQLDVIERCMALWSTLDDVVLTPFAGIGSEVFVAVKNDRKGIGVELKDTYYAQAIANCQKAEDAQTHDTLMLF